MPPSQDREALASPDTLFANHWTRRRCTHSETFLAEVELETRAESPDFVQQEFDAALATNLARQTNFPTIRAPERESVRALTHEGPDHLPMDKLRSLAAA